MSDAKIVQPVRAGASMTVAVALTLVTGTAMAALP